MSMTEAERWTVHRRTDLRRDRRGTSSETRFADRRRRCGPTPQGNSQHRIATLAGMARTENDTWDLATSVGATATMVAAGRGRATQAAGAEATVDPRAGPIDLGDDWPPALRRGGLA